MKKLGFGAMRLPLKNFEDKASKGACGAVRQEQLCVCG